MFGKLTFAAFENGPIVFGADAFMALIGLAVIGLLFYFHRWGWLWREWMTSLDPKRIGIMYMIGALVMLVRGLIDALMMRSQQAIALAPSGGYLPPDHFDQIFTGHGVIMIFFVAMPLMFAFFNLIVPPQIGSRDVAFPFLNSISFWLFVAAAVLMNLSLAIGDFAATGWLAYPPLSEIAYSPTVGVDYYIWVLQISGIGTLLAGINFFATITSMRAPGMTLMRMPIFVWTVLVTSVMIIFAFPILTATMNMLFLDRFMGFHFFTDGAGGNPMMYINLIWAWGHPEVYILVLPAFGIYSEIVATYSQKRLFGYTSMVYATAAIGVFSFIVWVHHFFTMGSGADVNAFFGIMTMIIAIPTGVKIFNWLLTMYRGRIIFSSPMHWFFGFIATFTVGGMTGVLMAIPSADFQLHNSLFLVAHFHTMIIGGVVFGYLAGLTYWFPKFLGFRLDERWGIRAFWCWLVGFLFAFVPLYVLGIMGMTRRLDTYTTAAWQPLLAIALLGAVIIATGVACQVIQIIVSVRDRKLNRDATGDPWNGRTLEWTTPSPMPAYVFPSIPQVLARDALAEQKSSGKGYELGAPEDITMPKSSPFGFLIGASALVGGFAIVWHILWLIPLSLIAIAACLIIRSFARDEDLEYVIPAAEVARTEAALRPTSL